MASQGRNPRARAGLRLAAVAVGALALAPATAGAHTYTVQPGDTLYGIGSVNGQSAQSVAAASGRSPYALLPVGATVVVPDGVSTVGATSTSTSSTSSTATQNVPTSGSGVVPVPAASGTAYLRSDAASALSGLSQASRQRLGTAVYPAGPMSGWRS